MKCLDCGAVAIVFLLGGIFFAACSQPVSNPAPIQDELPIQSTTTPKVQESPVAPAPIKTEFELLLGKAEQGDAESQFKVGYALFSGKSVAKNVHDAFSWFSKSSDAGNVKAKFMLGAFYDDGISVEKDKEKAEQIFQDSIIGLMPLAVSGDSEAQRFLGYLYFHDVGIPVDFNKAFEWYAKAAEQGDVIAQGMLSTMYANGQGVPKDEEKAFECLTKAAEKGNAQYQLNLGFMYANGQGVPKDEMKAAEWFTKAAEQDNSDAQFNLGLMYANGKGLSKDEKKAFEWFTKAAEQDNSAAQFNLGLMYTNGQGVSKDEMKAIEWFTKAAEQGLARSQFILGTVYFNGQSVSKDKKKAFEWYTKAAGQGLADAQNNLGLMYANGDGVTKDEKKAIEWYTKAAEQGVARAQYNLGYMYANSEGVPKDDKKVVEWYTKAAEQGNAGAQFNLALMYANGQGVPKDKKKAVEWYTKAAEQNIAEAQFNLGLIYLNGDGVPKNEKKAVEWYTKAAEQGLANAQAILGILYQDGKGVPQNFEASYAWYNLAAAQDVQIARESRDKLSLKMTPEQIANAQRLSQDLMATIDASKSGSSDNSEMTQAIPSMIPIGTGTGFFVTDDGWFVTCAHVVEVGNSYSIKLVDKDYPATLKRVDKENDLALLKVDGNFKAIPILSSRSVNLGDAIFTVGFPNPQLQGFSPKLTRGDISSISGLADDPRYFQISVAVQPGNSGGALVNNSGQVIGVVTSRINDKAAIEATGTIPQNINYAIKSSYLLALLESEADAVKGLLAEGDISGTPEKAVEAATAIVIVMK